MLQPEIRALQRKWAGKPDTPDLKRRLGQSSAAAALRYLHAVEGRDREVAQALSRLAQAGDAAQLQRKLGTWCRTYVARTKVGWRLTCGGVRA